MSRKNNRYMVGGLALSLAPCTSSLLSKMVPGCFLAAQNLFLGAGDGGMISGLSPGFSIELYEERLRS